MQSSLAYFAGTYFVLKYMHRWRICLVDSFSSVCFTGYMCVDTYWNEGGLESPIPPVLSSGGGSSVWLSVHTDIPSVWELSANTSYKHTHKCMFKKCNHLVAFCAQCASFNGSSLSLTQFGWTGCLKISTKLMIKESNEQRCQRR